MHNGCCLDCHPLDTIACTVEQPISFTSEQFVAQRIVQLVFGIMGQSALWNTVWQLSSLTRVYMQSAVVTVSQLCFPVFSEVNESKAAQVRSPCLPSSLPCPVALSLVFSLCTLFGNFESNDVPPNLELYLTPSVRGTAFGFHYTSLALKAFSCPATCVIPPPIYEKFNTTLLQADVIVLLLYFNLDICLFKGLFLGLFYLSHSRCIFSVTTLNKESPRQNDITVDYSHVVQPEVMLSPNYAAAFS